MNDETNVKTAEPDINTDTDTDTDTDTTTTRVRTLRTTASTTLCTDSAAIERAAGWIDRIKAEYGHAGPDDANLPEDLERLEETLDALTTLLFIRTSEREYPGTFQRIVDDLLPAKAEEP